MIQKLIENFRSRKQSPGLSTQTFSNVASLCLLLFCLSGCDSGDILSPQGGSSSSDQDQGQTVGSSQSDDEDFDAECRRACTLECIGETSADGLSFQLICIPRSYQGEVEQEDIENGIVELIEAGQVKNSSQLADECQERPQPVCDGDA